MSFLVFWLQTEIMLLGLFFALVFALGLHFGSCGNETVCILDPIPPFGTIENKSIYVSDVIL